jgi:hypothetical protein
VVSIRVEKSNLTGEKGVEWGRPKGLVYKLIGLIEDFKNALYRGIPDGNVLIVYSASG